MEEDRSHGICGGNTGGADTLVASKRCFEIKFCPVLRVEGFRQAKTPCTYCHRPNHTAPDNIEHCQYRLILEDDGGDGWGDSFIGIKQGDSLWQFKISGNGIYSETFALTLNSYDEVEMYYFEIATPQQNAQQLDIQTIQNSFKLENGYGVILYEGNNPWPGPNENKLRN